MQWLKKNKMQLVKYFLMLVFQGAMILVLGVDLPFLKRIFTDLMLRGLSLDNLQEHLKIIYDLKISKVEIQKIQDEGSIKARSLNASFDKIVAPKITKVEADEIFQGKDTVTLGAVAKGFNYLMGLHWSPDRTKESIAEFLRPIGKCFFNVKVVITDLFSGYKDLIHDVFQKAIHLECHLHAGRLLRRALQHLSAALTRRKKDLVQVQKSDVQHAKKMDKITIRVNFLDDHLEKDQIKWVQLFVKKHSSSSKCTKTLDHQLAVITPRMDKDIDELETLQSQQILLENANQESIPKKVQTEKSIADAHQDLLQSARLVHNFERLLKDFSPEFEEHKEAFLTRLDSSSYSMGKEIKKMIQDNPDLFSVRNARVLGANFQNTNTIEGVFALYRRLLETTRLLSSEAGSDRYCDLFRLYHNTMPPFTGPHQHESPVERLGVNLHGKNYLDLLYPTRHRITHIFAGNHLSQSEKMRNFHPIKAAQAIFLAE
jgi:hypothetical protein